MVGLGLGIAGCVTGILGINLRPFLGAKAEIRVADLAFVPSPELSRVLAFGHNNSVARLRWIDSLSYLQLQFDKRDDTLPDGSHGFTRLYDGLLALDERFLPLYHHASLTVGSIAGRPGEALGYLLRGQMVAPHDFSLRQHAAALLVTEFDIETKSPEMFNQYLSAWADAMEDEGHRNGVWQWQAGLARRRFAGLDQVGYWRERLFATKPGTPLSDFIEGVLRDQIARYACSVLQRVADSRLAAGEPVRGIADLLDPERLNDVGSDVTWGPVGVGDLGQPTLRSDPWGYAFVWREDAVVSQGAQRHWLSGQVTRLNAEIASQAADRGEWPTSLDEARSWLEHWPKPVPGLDLVWRDRQVAIDDPGPAAEPWPLR